MPVLRRKWVKRPFNCHCHARRIASGGIWLPGSQLACHLPATEGKAPSSVPASAAAAGFAAKGPARAGGELVVCAPVPPFPKDVPGPRSTLLPHTLGEPGALAGDPHLLARPALRRTEAR